MKNFVHKLYSGRDSKITVLLILSVFIFIGLACRGGSKTETKPIPQAFLGDWVGQDGTTISIRADGTGDYHSGSTKVDGGTAAVNEAERTLSITYFGIGKTLKVDQPPSGDQMKLDGVTFKRKGGFTSTETTSTNTTTTDTTKSSTPFSTDRPPTTSTSKADASRGTVPADDELQDMTHTALTDFNNAVQQGDFTDFYATISKAWQKQTTPETFNQGFKEFIDKKVDISKSNSMDASFSPEPSVEKKGGTSVLNVQGRYETSPLPVKFKLTYIPEGKQWKLFGIEVDTTR
jgi:hypothetical protein